MAQGAEQRFTIAVIPDTQNYLDYSHQREAGFPIDAKDIFIDQMEYIARNARSAGGDIVFATSVGDIWQHGSRSMDVEHVAKGLKAIPNPVFGNYLSPEPRTLTVEMPIARAGYEILASKLPFSVVPGNHDYDAVWSDSRWPATMKTGDPRSYGMLHYGGLDNFRAVFGSNSQFFKGKPWYVASFNGGADSAQVFEAGGYRFLHIGLEMAPEDDVIEWAQALLEKYPGIPTIISIHDHLNTEGERKPIAAVDFDAVHGEHNSPEELWQKLILRSDQIFMVLSGHQHGQSHATDKNAFGHDVHQILADYQDRGQLLPMIAPEAPKAALGDGWLRLMTFDFSTSNPTVSVQTYSTYFHTSSDRMTNYPTLYKQHEKPSESDGAFRTEENFTLNLADFNERFSKAKVGTK
ncbi:Ser/Thr protein phosphatase [Sphingobium lactosutens DS20]|uniref:Ser/Thr protein phosphatase n=2 Tax=Sphingomonadaceae TaxID=41297 RepID=T0IMD3_9SPHN|nr:Ser/Thr protein phosphatase [Sphingobium lactosutens DS20]